MSELNTYYIPTRSGNSCLCYLKSEADKVIAAKDKQIDLYKRGWAESDRINTFLYKRLRHHQYKRCFDKAELWLERYENSTDEANKEVSLERHKKWLELAEKFKEGK